MEEDRRNPRTSTHADRAPCVHKLIKNNFLLAYRVLVVVLVVVALREI